MRTALCKTGHRRCAGILWGSGFGGRIPRLHLGAGPGSGPRQEEGFDMLKEFKAFIVHPDSVLGLLGGRAVKQGQIVQRDVSGSVPENTFDRLF